MRLILSLGTMPLANSFLETERLTVAEPTYPLDLAFCPQCSLVQITETVPPEVLFTDYLYLSSYSQTMLESSKALADRLIEMRRLKRNNLVVELGSNDGYQLQFFSAKGIQVLGIDPARNVAKIAEAKGIRTVCDFFGEELAQDLARKNLYGDIILGKNVLAHVADLNGFVEGIHTLLKPNGVAVIEVPYLKDLIDRREFDTIYHEHLCYFSVTALDRLFKRHSLRLVDLEHLPIHGGTLRLFLSHESAKPSPAIESKLREEQGWGVDRFESYEGFANEVEKIRVELLKLLQSLKNRGKRIAAYGAAAKGTVLLNYCNVGSNILEFVVDVSPFKQGRYMPGVHLKIYPPSRLVETMPDYTLLLTWNIADEILKQQTQYRDGGGRFIIPVPEPKILED